MTKEQVLHLLATDLEYNMDQANYEPVRLLTNVRYGNHITELDAFYLEVEGKFYQASMTEIKKEDLPELELEWYDDILNHDILDHE